VSRLLQRINTKGPRFGRCNICGDERPLTEDHTPPKSCGLVNQMELQSLHDKVVASGERWHQPRRFQAGVSFRSLCARCNNLLGAQYDPALADLCRQVRDLANTTLYLGPAVSVKIRPQAVMRSVLGHLAAQGVDRYPKGPLTEPLRDYILDGTASLPAQLRIYYWFYPYRAQVLVRDAARMELGLDITLAFWLMKFFPLAFYVTHNEPQHRLYSLHNLDTFGNMPLAQEEVVPIQLRPLVHSEWPERPGSNDAIMYGQQAVSASPLSKVRRT